MKETGIPFVAPMVRAVIAGRKTQTRRPAKLPDWWPKTAARAVIGPGPQFWPVGADGNRIGHVGLPARQCRYGVPGDRLWVREAWARRLDEDHIAPRDLERHYPAWYWADPQTCNTGCAGGAGRRRPAMFMPRWASRLTLEVTEVRLERVRSISQADAHAEGFEPGVMMDGTVNGEPAKIAVTDPVYWFAMLWNTIHGKGAYADDPWVWVVVFRLLEDAAREKTRSTTTTSGGSDGNEKGKSEGTGARQGGRRALR